MYGNDRTYNLVLRTESGGGSPTWLVVLLLLALLVTGGLLGQSRKQATEIQSKYEASQQDLSKTEADKTTCQRELEVLKKEKELFQAGKVVIPVTGESVEAVEPEPRGWSTLEAVLLVGGGMIAGIMLTVLVYQILALNAPHKK